MSSAQARATMTIPLLSATLIAFTLHLSASCLAAPLPTNPAGPLCKRTRFGGRLLDSRVFLPADDLFDDRERSDARKVMLKTVLEPLIAKPLIEIVAAFSSVSPSRLFAEELYAELYAGRTDLLEGELYDAQRGVLNESHHFWAYLSDAALPTVMIFVHMLWCARVMARFPGFVNLAFERVPQASCFAAHYFHDNRPSALPVNVSMDEWPQALTNDKTFFQFTNLSFFELLKRTHYLLTRNKVKQLKASVLGASLDRSTWNNVLCALHRVEPDLLLKLLDATDPSDLFVNKELFEMAFCTAHSADPKLHLFLKAMAKSRGWKESRVEQAHQEHKDDRHAGGSVHMQPLTPVAKHLGCGDKDLPIAMSSTGKTASSGSCTHLFISANNWLCAHSIFKRPHLYIRSFESGRVSSFGVSAETVVQVKVQPGDVVAIAEHERYPHFLQQPIDCTGLSPEDCLARLKTFCYLIKSNVDFLAVIESDPLSRAEEGKVKEREKAKRRRVCERTWKEAWWLTEQPAAGRRGGGSVWGKDK